MAELLSVVSEALRSQWPDIQLDGSAHWSAPHRQALRDHLVQRFSVSPDLAQIPASPQFSLSVSHCPDWGGFVFTQSKNLSVGFDVEITQRVTYASVARMANREELSAAPHEALLWCAKEAAFKALRPHSQPPTSSAVRVSEWQTLENGWRFQFGQKSHGLALQTPKHTWAFAVISL